MRVAAIVALVWAMFATTAVVDQRSEAAAATTADAAERLRSLAARQANTELPRYESFPLDTGDYHTKLTFEDADPNDDERIGSELLIMSLSPARTEVWLQAGGNIARHSLEPFATIGLDVAGGAAAATVWSSAEVVGAVRTTTSWQDARRTVQGSGREIVAQLDRTKVAIPSVRPGMRVRLKQNNMMLSAEIVCVSTFTGTELFRDSVSRGEAGVVEFTIDAAEIPEGVIEIGVVCRSTNSSEIEAWAIGGTVQQPSIWTTGQPVQEVRERNLSTAIDAFTTAKTNLDDAVEQLNMHAGAVGPFAELEAVRSEFWKLSGYGPIWQAYQTASQDLARVVTWNSSLVAADAPELVEATALLMGGPETYRVAPAYRYNVASLGLSGAAAISDEVFGAYASAAPHALENVGTYTARPDLTTKAFIALARMFGHRYVSAPVDGAPPFVATALGGSPDYIDLGELAEDVEELNTQAQPWHGMSSSEERVGALMTGVRSVTTSFSGVDETLAAKLQQQRQSWAFVFVAAAAANFWFNYSDTVGEAEATADYTTLINFAAATVGAADELLNVAYLLTWVERFASSSTTWVWARGALGLVARFAPAIGVFVSVVIAASEREDSDALRLANTAVIVGGAMLVVAGLLALPGLAFAAGVVQLVGAIGAIFAREGARRARNFQELTDMSNTGLFDLLNEDAREDVLCLLEGTTYSPEAEQSGPNPELSLDLLRGLATDGRVPGHTQNGAFTIPELIELGGCDHIAWSKEFFMHSGAAATLAYANDHQCTLNRANCSGRLLIDRMFQQEGFDIGRVFGAKVMRAFVVDWVGDAWDRAATSFNNPNGSESAFIRRLCGELGKGQGFIARGEKLFDRLWQPADGVRAAQVADGEGCRLEACADAVNGAAVDVSLRQTTDCSTATVPSDIPYLINNGQPDFRVTVSYLGLGEADASVQIRAILVRPNGISAATNVLSCRNDCQVDVGELFSTAQVSNPTDGQQLAGWSLCLALWGTNDPNRDDPIGELREFDRICNADTLRFVALDQQVFLPLIIGGTGSIISDPSNPPSAGPVVAAILTSDVDEIQEVRIGKRSLADPGPVIEVRRLSGAPLAQALERDGNVIRLAVGPVEDLANHCLTLGVIDVNQAAFESDIECSSVPVLRYGVEPSGGDIDLTLSYRMLTGDLASLEISEALLEQLGAGIGNIQRRVVTADELRAQGALVGRRFINMTLGSYADEQARCFFINAVSTDGSELDGGWDCAAPQIGQQTVVAVDTSGRSTGVRVTRGPGGFAAGTEYSPFSEDAGHTIFDSFDWNGDGVADLVGLQLNDSTRGAHLRIADGRNFRNVLVDERTVLGVSGVWRAADWDFDVGDWNRDGQPDLVVTKLKGDSNSTEIHVIDGANPGRFLTQQATALPQTDGTWSYSAANWNPQVDSQLDLVGIRRLGDNATEIHVVDGANPMSFLLQTRTVLHRTDANWQFDTGDWNGDGRVDVVGVKRFGAGGNSELHVINGADPSTFLLQGPTGFGPTGANWQFSVPDVEAIRTFENLASPAIPVNQGPVFTIDRAIAGSTRIIGTGPRGVPITLRYSFGYDELARTVIGPDGVFEVVLSEPLPAFGQDRLVSVFLGDLGDRRNIDGWANEDFNGGNDEYRTIPLVGFRVTAADVTSSPAFSIDEPVDGADTRVTGTGPRGLPIRLINASDLGSIIAETVIGPDGGFVFEFAEPIGAQLSVGLQLGNLDLVQNVDGWRYEDFRVSPQYFERPFTGIFFDLVSTTGVRPPPPPTPTPVPRPTATPRPTVTPIPTSTATPRPTVTPIPTSTATPRPTVTPIPTSTATPRPTVTPIPTSTATPRPTVTPIPTSTPRPTPPPTATAVPTPTPLPAPSGFSVIWTGSRHGTTNGLMEWRWDTSLSHLADRVYTGIEGRSGGNIFPSDQGYASRSLDLSDVEGTCWWIQLYQPFGQMDRARSCIQIIPAPTPTPRPTAAPSPTPRPTAVPLPAPTGFSIVWHEPSPGSNTGWTEFEWDPMPDAGSDRVIAIKEGNSGGIVFPAEDGFGRRRLSRDVVEDTCWTLSLVQPVGRAPTATACVEIIPAQAPEVLLGDVSCDGTVNVVDALFIMQHVVGLRSDHGSCPLPRGTLSINAGNGDVNVNGRTDVVDALFIMRCEVGFTNVFCP